MSNNANRYGGHGDRGVKGRGKNGDRNTNNRDNKVNHVGNSEPKQKNLDDLVDEYGETTIFVALVNKMMKA